jgi:hypothetical protein
VRRHHYHQRLKVSSVAHAILAQMGDVPISMGTMSLVQEMRGESEIADTVPVARGYFQSLMESGAL